MADRPIAVFLDRDGTVIHDRYYLGDPTGVELLPGAGDAVARLNAAGYPVILVTNQSGIGRGRFSEADYLAVHERLSQLLQHAGARLDGEYHCPDAPAAEDVTGCRKPGTAMFVRAALDHGLSLEGSFFVGDRLRDVLPARELGGVAVLVRSPQTEMAEAERLPFVHRANSLAEAADWILANAHPSD